MAPLDWVVLAVYLVGIVAFGMWAGRGSRRMDEFFLAGRSMRWWAIGLSVMATQISAITFVGTTGQAYTDGMRFLVVYFGLPFAMVILCVTLVPFFYRARVFTAYEYLEKRFDARTRTLTSLLFLFGRGLSVGVTLYAPSLVLSVILGWTETATILVMGLSTIVYVVYGGNRSVIWTDVAQMALIWFGIFLCLGMAVARLPAGVSFGDGLAIAQAAGRLNAMDTTVSFSQPYTLWSGIVAGTFLALAYFGTDQSQVQRYLSGASLTQSRLSLLFNAFLKVPMQFVILLTGVLVFVYYHFAAPPLLWNAPTLARLEREAPPAELAAVREGFARAHEQRRQAAEALARDRGQQAPYLEAQRAVDAARGEAVALTKRVLGGDYNDTNYIFPTYILSTLRGGLAGLVIAVIFAAAMSTLSGELNSLATASMVDFYKRYLRPQATEAQDLFTSRVLTALWGAFAVLVALRARQLGSAIETVNRFGSYVYGPILGVFLLAVFTRVGASAAFAAILVGEAVVMALAVTGAVHWLWFNVFGAAAVFGSGLLLSALRRRSAPASA
jgi:Na+/proline symporter